MSEKRYVVPEGMLKAAHEILSPMASSTHISFALASTLSWLSENPIVPSDDRIGEMLAAKNHFIGHFDPTDWIRWGAAEWQRRMFLAPEPVAPEEVKRLLFTTFTHIRREDANVAILEAYRRGQRSKL